MIGPEILARTLSTPTRRGKGERAWQYHPRSDAHSKIACWTLLLDCLLECDALFEDAAAGRIGFAINHLMVGPINKTLDLVLTRVPRSRSDHAGRRSFGEVGASYGIQLSDEERMRLAPFHGVFEETSADVSEVVIAVEARACMTNHLGALPRLHREVVATGYLASRAAPRCVLVSCTLVNTAPSFISGNGQTRTMRQPDNARAVLDMLRSAIPLRREARDLYGYDAVGALAIECRNDGSPVNRSTGAAAPAVTDTLRYEHMIQQTCTTYRGKR